MSGNDFRPGRRSRKGRPQMPPEVQAVADELSRRAAEMWAEADGELSIAEAVELAAFRMGVETPQSVTEPAVES
ncbi:hypothetical protein [Streptomyces europaeiscabiei]|uniref:Uncharacterized protein n=1 Tax=Streptomyces europaeiscabiei TaxID=146819 RepID=A0ABU4P0G1_9ACTN|nr:hypothetical protein [Streptomyces europaeiscabiei]MDX2528013.1 hypothetical protein [Streptomyces europaeiscabiei]MDX3550130.1 hypothetical protein [Streptomyces europaeiscabiei]MDX3558810.1 hypothetical protein [Streptomyces europaeiscabiei]MDX3707254.1 hypothetical protein [Streptomyces europaeiscabiei]